MIRTRSSRMLYIFGLAILLILSAATLSLAETKPALYATGWSILPPIVAIALALITKEVYSSLFLGVLTGACLYAGPTFPGIIKKVVNDGIIASISDSYNVGILVFLVVLGMLVSMMNKSGGSMAFGRWASTKIKSRRGAKLSTIGLGILIFVDDYFNCLTVGSVMKPLTDTHKVSRAKLAYLIDSTAAPICILAPISSWAAAVSGFVKGQNGLTIFIKAIPYNFYALLTIVMMVSITLMQFDYGKMAMYERNAVENDDLFTVKDINSENAELSKNEVNPNGRVIDLIFPVIILIISCVVGMIYTGGFFSGTPFASAFANCDAAASLSMGSIFALIVSILYYVLRRILSFESVMKCVPEGFQSMVAPILVLTFAWSLKAMTDQLGLAKYVAGLVDNLGDGFISFLPAILFLIACGLGIASGTSWGTFGILIPIALAITANRPDLMIIVISACMAGGVAGDHCSPISDTTIMSSAGAGCNHLSHVESQFPYALTVMAVSFITYVIAGFTRNAWISLPIGIVLTLLVLFFIRKKRLFGAVFLDEMNPSNQI